MSHRIEWEKDGAYWQLSGAVTSGELIEIVNELIGSPKFDSLKYFILDATNIIEPIITEDDLDATAAIVKSTNSYKPKMKGAYVTKDKQTVELIGYYINKSLKLGSTWDRKIFNNVEDARSWVLS